MSARALPILGGFRIVLVLAFGLGAVGSALAAGTVDERRPLNADGRVYVNNVAGSIAVATWDRNEVTLRGELGNAASQVELGGDAASLNINVKPSQNSHDTGGADLQLMMPATARLELETVSADIAVQDLSGPLKINTVSGDVQLQLMSPEVSVQTVSGDVTLRAPAKLTTIKTVSGDLHLAGMQGRVGIDTVSGNVQLDGGRFSEARLKSVSGDLRLDLTLTEHAQLIGDTLSGAILLAVPADVAGTALLKSFSGEASCGSCPPEAARAVLVSRGGKREYTWGDGAGARVELSSFSGDINVERKPVRGAQKSPPFIGKD